MIDHEEDKIVTIKDSAYYKRLNYRMVLEFNQEDEVHIVKFPELPGCIADGESPQKALKNALKAKNEWIDTALEAGFDVPEPSVPIETSGRVTSRLPKSTHKKLLERAEEEGVSLNHLILRYVSEGLERKDTKENVKTLILTEIKEILSILKQREQTSVTFDATAEWRATLEPAFVISGVESDVDVTGIKSDVDFKGKFLRYVGSLKNTWSQKESEECFPLIHSFQKEKEDA